MGLTNNKKEEEEAILFFLYIQAIKASYKNLITTITLITLITQDQITSYKAQM
jgi:hypothetical protein